MPNFFLDNEDIQFLFDHIDLAELARVQEDDFADARQRNIDYAPLDQTDAIDNYRRILEITGDIAANIIAPRAEQIDAEGHTLNADGTVTLHPLVADNIRRLGEDDGISAYFWGSEIRGVAYLDRVREARATIRRPPRS